jgi:hypothetical protein
MDVEGANRVTHDGRYRLPGSLREEYNGELLAAWVNDRGNIELKRVDRDGGGE